MNYTLLIIKIKIKKNNKNGKKTFNLFMCIKYIYN